MSYLDDYVSHATNAEDALDAARNLRQDAQGDDATHMLAAAQTHATLALAAATAYSQQSAMAQIRATHALASAVHAGHCPNCCPR